MPKNNKGPLLKKQQFSQWKPKRCCRHPLEPKMVTQSQMTVLCGSGHQAGWCTQPSSHSALLEMAQLTLVGMQAHFPCWNTDPQSSGLVLPDAQRSLSPHQLTSSWCVPDLPDSIKSSRPWGDPQLPSSQKYQCRVVHEDNTFQPFSFIYHPWNSIYWCFDQENHVSPYLVPSATILLIFHLCTREKRPDSACTAWPFAKENSQNNSSDLGSLWTLVNHNILSSENQRRETWSDPRFLNLNRKPRFSF